MVIFYFILIKNISHQLVTKIDNGDSSIKPGWLRISLHPTLTNDEFLFIINAIKEITENADEWTKDYHRELKSGEWFHNTYLFDNKRLTDAFDV